MTTGSLADTYTLVRCPCGAILAEVWGARPERVKAHCGDRGHRAVVEVYVEALDIRQRVAFK